jgi:chemotaxis protein methyltransferase CheR
MDQIVLHSYALEDEEFLRLQAFIQEELGIKMPQEKRVMLESRLQKRVKQLRMDSFSAYCDFVFSPDGMREELVNLIDCVTTNKTDFFREPNHFTYLKDVLIPGMAARGNGRIHDTVRIWSTACSTGEEPYTLAMVMESLREGYGSFEYRILATDISSRVLEVARRGVYSEERIVPVPDEYRRRYLLRSKDRSNPQARVKPMLRNRVSFGRLNLMSPAFGIRERFDIIFCRNVLIYFNKDTQEALLRKLYAHLQPGGHLFLGHSETLTGMHLRLQPVAATIYRKPDGRSNPNAG